MSPIKSPTNVQLVPTSEANVITKCHRDLSQSLDFEAIEIVIKKFSNYLQRVKLGEVKRSEQVDRCIMEWKEQIATLQNKGSQQAKANQTLASKVKDLDKEIVSLKSENASLKSENASENASLESKIKALADKVVQSITSTLGKRQRDEIYSLKVLSQSQSDEIKKLKETISVCTRVPADEVGLNTQDLDSDQSLQGSQGSLAGNDLETAAEDDHPPIDYNNLFK
jgi:predicted RNase H-like nuclease (RuvC/YqgF family)